MLVGMGGARELGKVDRQTEHLLEVAWSGGSRPGANGLMNDEGKVRTSVEMGLDDIHLPTRSKILAMMRV